MTDGWLAETVLAPGFKHCHSHGVDKFNCVARHRCTASAVGNERVPERRVPAATAQTPASRQVKLCVEQVAGTCVVIANDRSGGGGAWLTKRGWWHDAGRLAYLW
jgi:hypothetical protein